MQKSPPKPKSKLDQAKQELKTLLETIKVSKNELASILKVTENKQPILEELLRKIKEAEKVLEDNYSQRELELQKQHRDMKQQLESDLEQLESTLIEVQKECDIYKKKKEDQLDQLAITNLTLNTARSTNEKLSLQSKQLKALNIELSTTETKIINSIDDLQREKKVLEAINSSKVLQYNTQLFEMQTILKKEQSTLESQIESAEVKLKELQQMILLHGNKLVELQETEKKKDNDFIQRENAILIKTKALQKSQEEFDTEIRRWNYIKPLQN